MPELPDIVVLVRSMNEVLPGKTIANVVINQPKVLNVAASKFGDSVEGRTIGITSQRGKWALTELDKKWTIAFNLGMGGEIRLHGPDEIPDMGRERVVFLLDNGDQIWVHHWWFGHVHLVSKGDLSAHGSLSKLGPEPLSDGFTVDVLGRLLNKRRGRIKSYLLDQTFIAGIGNVYVQDILWRARLHPERKANTLDTEDIRRLHWAIQTTLEEGIKYGGGPKEHDIWGNEGRYPEHYQVAYRTGESCPECGTVIEEIRVRQTTSYLCSSCQG